MAFFVVIKWKIWVQFGGGVQWVREDKSLRRKQLSKGGRSLGGDPMHKEQEWKTTSGYLNVFSLLQYERRAKKKEWKQIH